MHALADKIEVTCPQCGRNLRVPADSLGKQARCPSCNGLFGVKETPYVGAAAPAAEVDPLHGLPIGEWPTQPLSPQRGTPPAFPTPYAPSASTTVAKNYNHGFGWEHRGWDKGMLGGVAMMAIAAVWFIAGLACGVIFYYPPILFIIGLVGFVRGLFTGNVTGRNDL